MPDLSASIGHCRAIAATDKPNLFLVSGALAEERRPFFYAAYAAMRIVDDLADTEVERLRTDEAARARALAGIACWHGRVERALQGDWAAEGNSHDPVFHALAATARGAGRTPGPWTALRASMEWDVSWRPVAGWDDFERYCRGACIAPAAIFFYLLGGADIERRLEGGDIMDLSAWCGDLAVFCYLIHGLRDLAKDAASSERLIVFPDEAVARHSGSKRALVAAALEGRADDLAGLVAEVLDRAEDRLARARAALAEGRKLLSLRGRLGIDVLAGLYAAHLERMRKDYRPYLAGQRDIDADARDRLMAPLASD